MARGLALGLLVGAPFLYGVSPGVAQMTSATSRLSEFHVVMAGAVGRAQVQHAISGAARRLASHRCQTIFTEFHDQSGQPLQGMLDASHQTGAQYLASLRFIEGGDQPRCRRSSSVVAFIEPGSHVVWICGDHFEAGFNHDPGMMEILLIHELLHALGLGENPPRPAEITQKVMARCGG
jgi:hypothetical protein